jgi:hypothetical protein
MSQKRTKKQSKKNIKPILKDKEYDIFLKPITNPYDEDF